MQLEFYFLQNQHFLFEHQYFRQQAKKPDLQIFRYLLDTYSLEPQASVFIDDQQDNIEAARALGFNGIVYQNQRTTEKELAKLGIIK